MRAKALMKIQNFRKFAKTKFPRVYHWLIKRSISDLNAFLTFTSALGVTVGATVYLTECQSRQDQKDLAAWHILATSQNSPLDGGRGLAIKELYEGGWPLKSVVAPRLYLESYQLEKVDFEFSNFDSAKFVKCNLKSANLSSGSFQYAEFLETDVSNTNFYQTNLTSAKFQRSKLIGVNFKTTNLSAVIFDNSDLKDADFSEASIHQADFRLAKNITSAQLQKAKGISCAYLTDDLIKELNARDVSELSPEQYKFECIDRQPA